MKFDTERIFMKFDTERIFMKFDTRVSSEKCVDRMPVSLTFDKNNDCFTCSPMRTCDDISVCSSCNE